jgi:hypothetical protein
LSKPRNRPVEIVEPERENPRKGRQSPCTAPIHAEGTVKLTAKPQKRPGRMGNISRLRVLSSLGQAGAAGKKVLTRDQSGGIGMHVR